MSISSIEHFTHSLVISRIFDQMCRFFYFCFFFVFFEWKKYAFSSWLVETKANGDTNPPNKSKMQLQQQLSQQQQELIQQLQLLHHQYLMHHGINLQQQFLSHKQKSHQLNGGRLHFILKPNIAEHYLIVRGILMWSIDLFQVDNALSLIKLGALDGLGNNCIENTSMHDLIYLSKLQSITICECNQCDWANKSIFN